MASSIARYITLIFLKNKQVRIIMNKLHIITPVKNSPITTEQTINSVLRSDFVGEFHYVVYDDFSNDTTKKMLNNYKDKVVVEDLANRTQHPSPNYLLVLQVAQQSAVKEQAHLLIVESDVVVEKNTINTLLLQLQELNKPGLVAAVTTDISGNINFPYDYAKGYTKGVVKTDKRLSFCCTLLSYELLKSYDFRQLDPEKSWYDIFISRKSVELDFSNYLLTNLPVVHQPHSSRPWKKLKYSNPLKYYWNKLTKGLDKF